MTTDELIKRLRTIAGDMLTEGESQRANSILAAAAKIESLEVSLQAMRNAANGYKSAYEREKGKSITAIQDFAERLKESIPNYIGYDDSQLHEYIDNLVKEMIGAQE